MPTSQYGVHDARFAESEAKPTFATHARRQTRETRIGLGDDQWRPQFHPQILAMTFDSL